MPSTQQIIASASTSTLTARKSSDYKPGFFKYRPLSRPVPVPAMPPPSSIQDIVAAKPSQTHAPPLCPLNTPTISSSSQLWDILPGAARCSYCTTMLKAHQLGEMGIRRHWMSASKIGYVCSEEAYKRAFKFMRQEVVDGLMDSMVIQNAGGRTMWDGLHEVVLTIKDKPDDPSSAISISPRQKNAQDSVHPGVAPLDWNRAVRDHDPWAYSICSELMYQHFRDNPEAPISPMSSTTAYSKL
jgi:hypothetical protein